jgi:hypothetical protein
MSDDTLAAVILVLAVVCLVLIAIGLAGSVLWVSQQADSAERDEPERWR